MEVVIFDKKDLFVVSEDNNNYVQLKTLFTNIGFSEKKALNLIRKFKDDYVVSRGLREDIEYDTKGGVQKSFGLNIEYAPLLLAKISITPTMRKNDPDFCKILRHYQTECAIVLRDHFNVKSNGKLEEEQAMIKDSLVAQEKTLTSHNVGMHRLNDKMEEVLVENERAVRGYKELHDRLKAIETQYDYTDIGRLHRLMARWSTLTYKSYLPKLLTHHKGNYKMGTKFEKIGFYGALENRFNIKIKKSPSKYWNVIMDNKIPIEDIEDFILGVGTKYLLSEGGQWYNSQNGMNDKYDLDKMERFFFRKETNSIYANAHKTNCYMCGTNLRKHQYSREHMKAKVKHETVDEVAFMDLIYNIAPVGSSRMNQCDCNFLKGYDNTVKDMYDKDYMDKESYEKSKKWQEIMKPRAVDTQGIIDRFNKFCTGE